jgi:hypothetical protein
MTEAAKTTAPKTATKKPAAKVEAPSAGPKIDIKDRTIPARGGSDLMENIFSWGLLTAMVGIFAVAIYSLI